jgi:hypothetical protein
VKGPSDIDSQNKAGLWVALVELAAIQIRNNTSKRD